MKGLYIIGLAAAVSFTAAADRQQAAFNQSHRAKTPVARVLDGAKKISGSKKASRIRKAASLTEDKVYYWTATDMLEYDGVISEPLEIFNYDATTGNGTVYLADFEIPVAIDLEKGTFSISNNQKVGEDEDGPIYFYLKDFTSDYELVDGISKTPATVGTFTENGDIVFPADDIWALGDPADEDLGWYVLSCDNELLVSNPALNPDGNWVLSGKGTFTDNILGDLFVEDWKAEPVEVEVYADLDDPVRYMVKKPYQQLYKALGEDPEQCPPMVIDTTYPENILLYDQSVGLFDEEDGEYFIFSESSYNEDFGDGIDETPEELRIKMTTEGYVKTVTFPIESITLMGLDSFEMYYAAPAVSVLRWNTDPASVELLEEDEERSVPVYYNLQGIPVNNPQNGLYIIKTGNKVQKAILR
ncbi:MAG: hypothetical protein NC201_01110 [Prevotella sp.]|nr:hypothetical protein [Bacteroides sp.]MCM1365826.1 hypothetical protein [Prevotella sp.]MCM1436482.1 hypothetical protein [Prevotella sp.]